MCRKVLVWCAVWCPFWAAALPQSRNGPGYALSGIVIFDDGSPVPESTEVRLVCSGAVRQRVYSQPGGQFLLTLGDNRAPDPDITDTAASATGNRYPSFNGLGRAFGDDGGYARTRRYYLGDCELVASLTGFTSGVIRPGDRDLLQNPDVGSIVLHRRAQVRGSAISIKSLSAPEKATRRYQGASAELHRKTPSYAKALKHLQNAVGIYPQYAAAWHLIGRCYVALRKFANAREAYENAAAADPDYTLPYIGLAELGLQTGQFQQAVTWSSLALERDPGMTSASYLHAFASFSSGNIEAAETSIRKVEKSPEARGYPGIHYLLGAIRVAKGDVPAAVAEFRLFLELSPGYDGAERIKKQLALWAEQGIGDPNRPAAPQK